MVSTGERFAARTRSKAQNIGMRTDRVQQLYGQRRHCGLHPSSARFSPDLDLHLPARPDDIDLIVADVLSRTFYDESGVVDDGLEVRAVRCHDLHVGDEPG